MSEAVAWQAVTPEPRPDFKRDGRKRPLIMQPNGKRLAYTRCTTYVGAPEDLYNVHQWEKRQVSLGLAARPDLVQSVAANRTDKDELNRIADLAKEAAGASAAARRGSNIHAFSELVDQGLDLPPGLDNATLTSLAAYRDAMAPFKVNEIEVPLVNDPSKVAGTADRVITYRGNRYIADLKTGSTVELGTGKIAGQLAMYAHSRPYDVVAEKRLDHHGASVLWGLVIHLPADKPGTVALHWIDLDAGWRWCQLAGVTREFRSMKFAKWTKPFDPEARPEPSVRAVKADAKAAAEAAELAAERESIRRQIQASDTRALIEAVWKRSQRAWDASLTEVAKARISDIETTERNHA